VLLEEILERNRLFTAGRPATPLAPPEAIRLAVLACYDPRLDTLIRPALGLDRGEGFLLRTAGARISATGDPMRSFALAVYLFGVTHAIVLGHSSCRMATFETSAFIDSFRRRGVARTAFGDGDLRDWAGAIATPRRGVDEAITALAGAPFLPEDLSIAGLLLDDTTGAIEVVVRPEEALARRTLATGRAAEGAFGGPVGASFGAVSQAAPATPAAGDAPSPSGIPAAGASVGYVVHDRADEEAADALRAAGRSSPSRGAATAGGTGPADADALVGSLEEFLGVLEASAGWSGHVTNLRRELERQASPLGKIRLVRQFLDRATGDTSSVRDAFEKVEAAVRSRGRRLSADEVLPILRHLFKERRP